MRHGTTDFVGFRWQVSFHGHSLLGLLLGFLTVFRTQSGFSFYLEGQAHLATLSKTLRNIAIETLGSLPVEGASPEQATHILNIIRRSKLYYYAVVEHLRSNDSYDSWLEAHSTMLGFATAEELHELDEEFGSPTKNREAVTVPTLKLGEKEVKTTDPTAIIDPSLGTRRLSLGPRHSLTENAINKRLEVLEKIAVNHRRRSAINLGAGRRNSSTADAIAAVRAQRLAQDAVATDLEIAPRDGAAW